VKIADYGKAMSSYIEAPTRFEKNLSKKISEQESDRLQLAEGSDDQPLVPAKKPKQLKDLYERIDRAVLAISSNTLAPEYLLPDLEKITQEYIGDGLISGEDARKFAIERKKFYDAFIQQNAGGTLPTFDFDNEGNEIEVSDEEIIKRINKSRGGRIGFYKGELVTDGPNTGKYKVKFANKGTSPNYPDEFIGTQYYDSETAANQAITDRKEFSKKNIAVRDKKNIEMGKVKKSDYKKIIDSFIEEGDYKNFKTQLYESQMVELPSGKSRRTSGGRVPAHILKFIRDRLDAGPGSKGFAELMEITGRSEAELLDFKSKIPEKGYISIKDRSKTAIETSGVRKSEEEKLETEQKAKKKRIESELPGKKYASEAELKRFNVVNEQKKLLNKFFKENPKALLNTPFGKKIKELMDIRIDGDGNFFNNVRPDEYYIKKANDGIFDIFDINKISKGQINTKFTSNLNILPGQFNQAFIEGQVNKYFKKGGKLHGNETKLANISKYLEKIGVTVDIENVGRIGGGNKVFFDSKTNSYPHITNTLKKMDIPNELLSTSIAPEKGLVDLFPKITKYGGKAIKAASKVIKPLSIAVGPYAVMSAQDQAKAEGMDLSLLDKGMAFFMGDAQAAIDMNKMRNDPEYAAEVRAANLARPLDEGTYEAIEEITMDKPIKEDKQTFGKYNDQIKNIKLP
tara:strand:+ start:710 stop:2764 length:2055 start_codon:yes stop_codon:yes gene_type:complete